MSDTRGSVQGWGDDMLVWTFLLGLAAFGDDPCRDRDALVSDFPFFETETGRFAPMYPALARQVVDDFGITEGVAVDLGGGAGSLAIALASITDLLVYTVDIDPAAVRLADLQVDAAGLRGRVISLEGDAANLPLKDGIANLVVSRGSIFFWPDQLAGLRECWRLLAPGGVAYVGGGFSRGLDPAIRGPLVAWAKRQLLDPATNNGWRPLDPELADRARAEGIHVERVEQEPGIGMWIVLRKP